ncbi:MAG: hypothetical protein OK422_04270 [Thaumarchaeota archaeon]|nr:hypothetical protein [Nitrososphaerota archaeon]
MPKAGRYDYPYRDLDDCVEFLRKAFDTKKEYNMSRDSFATAIGQSSKGGGFNLLVGSLAMFGLVETGGGEIKYTELAKTILFGEPNQKPKAMEEAVRKVTVFAEVFDKYGANFTDEQLRLFLKDKAVVDIAEANSLAQLVGKSLKSHLKYLTPRDGGEKKQMTDLPANTQVDLVIGQGTLTTSFGTIKLLNQATLDLARKLLDVVESQMKEEQKALKPEPKKETKP